MDFGEEGWKLFEKKLEKFSCEDTEIVSLRKWMKYLFSLFLFTSENRLEAYFSLSSTSRTKTYGMRLKDREIYLIFTE